MRTHFKRRTSNVPLMGKSIVLLHLLQIQHMSSLLRAFRLQSAGVRWWGASEIVNAWNRLAHVKQVGNLGSCNIK